MKIWEKGPNRFEIDSYFRPSQIIIETIAARGLEFLYEKEEMDKARMHRIGRSGIGVVETLSGIFHALPNNNCIKPLGVVRRWGFPNLANALSAARGLQIKAGAIYLFNLHRPSGKAGFLRQMQDRALQANNTGFEIKQIDKQIISQQIRIEIAKPEITESAIGKDR